MFVELVELLRCPRDHEPSQLIAAAFRTAGRHIVDGELGCPVCHAEFPIREGALVMGEVLRAPAEPPSVEEAVRLAAFLGLTDARGFVVVCGAWGSHVAGLRALTEAPIVLVNPPEGVGEASATIVTPDRVPFAAGSARGAALAGDSSDALVRSVVRTVRAGGRVVGPSSLALPDGITEIARDERAWVGEKAAAPDGAPRLVTLRRAGT